jgi:hypothetical protein
MDFERVTDHLSMAAVFLKGGIICSPCMYRVCPLSCWSSYRFSCASGAAALYVPTGAMIVEQPLRNLGSRGLEETDELHSDLHPTPRLLHGVERQPFMLISRRTHHPSPLDVCCERWDR